MSEIKNPFAINSEGENIIINKKNFLKINTHTEFFCPICGDKLIPRKGEMK